MAKLLKNFSNHITKHIWFIFKLNEFQHLSQLEELISAIEEFNITAIFNLRHSNVEKIGRFHLEWEISYDKSGEKNPHPYILLGRDLLQIEIFKHYTIVKNDLNKTETVLKTQDFLDTLKEIASKQK